MSDPERPASAGPLRFSFVIANYNYGRFVGRAIESALALDWPEREVVVVDDGSTDDSRAVIESFGGRVTALFQPNGGQRSASNAGFARATGEVVVFLDADDVVEPGFARAVAAVWRPGVSKVQVPMRRVDADERPLGSVVPRLGEGGPPSPAAIRRWAFETTEYPTPPGSGNAYARWFLEGFFPLGPEHDVSTDSTCLALAPLLGDVVTLAEPLVLYRIHGSNDSNLLASDDRFGREVARAIRRQESAAAVCLRLGRPAPPLERLRRSRHLLQVRAASLRLMPEAHPMAGDGRLRAAGDALRAPFGPGFDPLPKRLALAAWTLAVLAAPRGLARRLVHRRFRRG